MTPASRLLPRLAWLGVCLLLVAGLAALPAGAQDKKKKDDKKTEKKDDKKDPKKDDKKDKEPEKKEPLKLETPKVELKGHTYWITCVAYNADGALLASASRDKTVKVWNLKTAKELHTLKGHPTEVKSLAFLPDNRLAVTSRQFNKKAKEWQEEIKLWDAAAAKEAKSIIGHTAFIESVAASADGGKLASASEDKLVKIWDTANGKEIHTLKGHTGAVLAVAFSKDGKMAVSGCVKEEVKKDPKKDPKIKKDEEKLVILWDVAAGKEITAFSGASRSITCVAFHPDGTRLAAGSMDGTIKVYDTAGKGKELFTLKAHELVWAVAFSPDGKKLATAGYDQTIKLWDADKGTLLRNINAHGLTVTTVAFSPDGSHLASGGLDQLVKIWSLADKK